MNTPEEQQTADFEKQRSACVACKRAKRRCSRQLPSCRRCSVQNVRCVYPTAVTQGRRLRSPQPLIQLADESPSDLSATGHAITLAVRDGSLCSLGPAATFESIDRLLGENHSAVSWFLAPSSWEVDHVAIGEDNRITFPDSGLDYFLDRLRLWLDQWTRENHCPFVHARLYGADISSHHQHALAAWQVYRAASTPASRRIALRTAIDWAGNLIRETALETSLLGPVAVPELVDQLACVQALLVFQVIGLFDGDVRARAHAESVLSTLTSWADALLQTAAAQVAAQLATQQQLEPEPDTTGGTLLSQHRITQLRSDGTTSSAWRAWILSESIRRVWIVATLTEAAFLIMKQGFATCPGSIAFTGKSGIWDASSPREWMTNLGRQSRTKDPVFCRGLDRLLEEAGPLDVDEFTETLLAYGRGGEVLEDWKSSA